jgi:F-type H+-transporting ATPase subunit b
MPQMEFGDYAPQLIWLAITFVAFYVLMARVALPRIADVLEQRQLRVANDLEQAQTLRDEAAKALEAYEATLAEARNQAHAIAIEARDQIAAEAEQRRLAFESELDKRIAEEEARIAKAIAEVGDHVRDVAISTARAAGLKLLGEDMPADALNRAIDAQLEQTA